MPQLSFLSDVGLGLSIFVFFSPNLKIKSHKRGIKVFNFENVFVKPQQFFSFADLNFYLKWIWHTSASAVCLYLLKLTFKNILSSIWTMTAAEVTFVLYVFYTKHILNKVHDVGSYRKIC